MKILKYEKLSNDLYKIYLDNNQSIKVHEQVIIDNNLLYKKDLTKELYNKLIKENTNQEYYVTAVKYIGIRLRSKKEIKDYLKKKNVNVDLIENIINKLEENNLLNDNIFAEAFIKDKLNFTTSGPYKIKLELKRLGVDDNIISDKINNIPEDLLIKKISKLIDKYIKSHQKYKGNELKFKIYNYINNLGYTTSMISMCLNNFEI